MTNGEIDSPAFHEAELHSERTRVNALLRVFAGLLGLLLIRGAVSLAEGRRSVVWPFGVLLALIAVYEVMWLQICRPIHSVQPRCLRQRMDVQQSYRVPRTGSRTFSGNPHVICKSG